MKRTDTNSSYGLTSPTIPTTEPSKDQIVRAARSEHPLTGVHTTQFYGLAGPCADRIEITLTGRCRRVSDGALAKLSGTLEIDAHGTLRNWIRVPINPDAGGIVGNVINSTDVHPLGSMWIHAPINTQLTPTGADREWEAKGIMGQLSALLRGMVMYTSDATAWEVLVESANATVCIHEVVGIDGTQA